MVTSEDLKNAYWKIANKAIKLHIIDTTTANMIARVGQRKERYWARHLRDLIEFLESKSELRDEINEARKLLGA